MASLRPRKQSETPTGEKRGHDAETLALEAQRARGGALKPRPAAEMPLRQKLAIVLAVMALVVLGFYGRNAEEEDPRAPGTLKDEVVNNGAAILNTNPVMTRDVDDGAARSEDVDENPADPVQDESPGSEVSEDPTSFASSELAEEEEETEDTAPSSVTSSHVRTKVCVQGPNPRVSSLFVRNGLREFGSQIDFVMAPMLRDQLTQFVTSGAVRADAIPAPEPCDPSWPRLNLAFQKGLTTRTLDTPGQTTFVVGDEYCKCPSGLCGGASAAVPLRQYFTTELTSTYLPLGPRFEFIPVPATELKPASTRKYLYNFAGALTSGSRKQLAAILSAGQQDPQSVLSNGFVNVAPAWKKDAMAETYVSPTAYRAAVLDSAFTLCPAGTNPEAFRIYEAMDSGSIPVMVRDAEYLAHPCKDAFKPLLDSGAPFVVMQDWSELESTLARLAPRVDEIQEELLQWRRRFWTELASKVDCAVLGRHARDTGASYSGLSKCPPMTTTSMTRAAESLTHIIPPAGSPTVSQSDLLAMTPQRPPAVGSQDSVPLITGCGRSGTLSLMEYLRSIGVQAVHEQVATAHVSVSWLYAADSDVYPFEFKNSLILRKKIKASLPADKPLFGPVVHLTRHPLKVMSSTRRCFCGMGDRTRARGAKNDKRSWVFAEQFIPRMRADLPYESLERSALYWLEWNKMIEAKFANSVHVRLEDLDPVVLVRALGLASIDATSLPRAIPRAKFHTSPDKEKVKLPDVTWTELNALDPALASEIFQLAQHYGYELDSSLEENLAQGK